MTISTEHKQRKREECRDCKHWSSGKGVSWLGGVPDWCGEYAEPMRGDELACAGFQPTSAEPSDD